MTTPRRFASALRRALAVGALTVGALGPFALPASAQGFYYPQALIAPHSIVGMLRQQGFSRLSQPILNRDVYFLDAIDPYGRPMRVIVSAFNGHIVAAHPQRGRGGVLIDPDDEDDLRPPLQRDWARRDPGAWPADPRQPLPDLPNAAPQAQPVPKRAPTPPRDANALPPLAPSAPADKTLPQPTPKNPTVVKRSPTALPKDGASSIDSPGKLAPAPGLGTRDKPRVIDIAPRPADSTAPAPASPPTAAAPQPRLEAPATPPLSPAPPSSAPAPERAPPAPQAAAPVAPPAAPPPELKPPPQVQKTPDTGQSVKDYRTVPPAILD